MKNFKTIQFIATRLKHMQQYMQQRMPYLRAQLHLHWLILTPRSLRAPKPALRQLLHYAKITCGLSLALLIGYATAQTTEDSQAQELKTSGFTTQLGMAGGLQNIPSNSLQANLQTSLQNNAQDPHIVQLSFPQLGAANPIRLRGISSSKELTFGVRLDETVTRARLKLNFIHSPALLTALSHLKIYLNDELIATINLNKEEGGQALSREIEIDPRLLLDFNHLRIQMIGHYTITECEDPWHSSLWVELNNDSAVTLWTRALALNDDLALLPAPLFDYRDSRTLHLPVVMPAHPSTGMQQAAGIVTSWFGALAGYRKAQFTVAQNFPENSHAVVFATRAENSLGIDLSKIDGPTLAMQANPAAPDKKILLVLGRDEKDLQSAALALTSGKIAMSGRAVMVKSLDIGSARKAYDAPNWAHTDRVLHLGELVNRPEELQAVGSPFGEYGAEVIRVNLKVAPDLFIWKNKNVPMNLKYRYMPPNNLSQAEARLTIDVNDLLVQSFSLEGNEGKNTERGRSSLLPLSALPTTGDVDLKIPGFKIEADNQLQFRFHLASEKIGRCETTLLQTLRADIDPDSTIDFSDFPHYLRMPNLAAFANSGFPFTKYADLAQTAVVMPVDPTPADLEVMLTLLGHMGRFTGLPAQRFTVVDSEHIKAAGSKDLLLIGDGSAKSLLDSWGKSLPLLLSSAERQAKINQPQYLSAWWHDVWQMGQGDDRGASQQAQVTKMDLRADGALAALIGFESPYNSGRSVVALTATRADEMRSLVLPGLSLPEQVAKIRGDVTFFNALPGIKSAGLKNAGVKNFNVEGFNIGDHYYVGSVPIWTRIQIYFYRAPFILAVLGILAGLLIAILIYWGLMRRSNSRIRNR